MPFATPADVPDNVPSKYKPQFQEVWNSVYAAAIADKKSPAQAEETAYTQAHGVINKAKQKDEAERSLRYSEDQPRDPDGKFGSGGTSSPHEHEAVAQAGYKITGSGAVNPLEMADKAAADHKAALAEHQKDLLAHMDTVAGTPERTAANEKLAASATKLSDAHQNLLASQGVKTDSQGRVPMQIGRGTYFAKYMPTSSAMPNALPTYHAETQSGTYFMTVTQHDVDRGNAKYTDKHRSLSQISEIREIYMSIERRFAAELRIGEGQPDEMALVGYAARFNSQSKDLGGFRETIAPGAFKRALAEGADVHCLFNHDANRVLGRTASGTLKLEEDGNGLKFRCQLDPNQQAHRDLHAAVKRGDINECSFAFTPNGEKGDHWEDRKDEQGNWFISRTLQDVNLFDVSAVTHPAYDNTSVQARQAANQTPEIRSIMSKMVEKRAKRSDITTEKDSLEDYISEVSKALADKFPAADDEKNYCGGFGGKYWICETYDNFVIASECGSGDYVKIPYIEDGSDNYVFGTPVPVEKEWVASERSKSVQGEVRALKAAHMQAIADAHKDQAAQHSAAAEAHSAVADEHNAHADAHTAAAESAQDDADRMAKCEATRGDCGIKGCRCQNQMVSVRDVEDEDWSDADDEEDWNPADHTDEENKEHYTERNLPANVEARAAARKAKKEARADEQVLTKKVGGKNLPAAAFTTVGDPKDTSTWKGVKKVKAADDKEAADRAAEKENLELRFRLAMAL